MADIAVTNSMLPFGRASGGGGGGSIELLKVNRDGTKERRTERNTDTIIPAGWASVSIYNSSINGPILVNGEQVWPQGNFNSANIIDWAALKQEFGGQITIVSNGNSFVFHVVYPTASAVDVATL